MSQGVTIIGAGGHGKVVLATAQTAGLVVEALYDDDEGRWGENVLGVQVVGPISDVPAGTQAILALGSNVARKRLASACDLDWQILVHPRAWVHPSAKIGVGTVVFAGAIIQPGASIGEHVVVNTGASVDHDATLEHFSFLGPGARLAGAAKLSEGAFLGVNAGVLPGCSVGAWTQIGAGGIVTQNIPAHVTAVGVPAKIVRAAK